MYFLSEVDEKLFSFKSVWACLIKFDNILRVTVKKIKIEGINFRPVERQTLTKGRRGIVTKFNQIS